MSTDEELLAQVNAILIGRSQEAVERSKQAVLTEEIKHEPLREALRYFMEEICYDSSHPTLLSLACEAVGGNPDDTLGVATAIVLLTAAADIHDDIIDKSEIKTSKPTLYGKFGGDMAIIAADVLYIKGMQVLQEATDIFAPERKREIVKLTKQAFFDIGSAEAKEASFKGNVDLDPDEYLELIKLKVSVAVASAEIGAIIGNGTSLQIENLGQYAETLGVLMTIREEFINMFEPDELKNRFKNECLPLPILFAFKDINLKSKILEFLKQGELTESSLNDVLEQVYASEEVRKLGSYMKEMVATMKRSLNYQKKARDELIRLIEFSLQDLPTGNKKD